MALDLGGIFGAVSAILSPAAIAPPLTPMVGVSPNGQQRIGVTPVGGGAIAVGAPQIIDMILDGAGDAAVRAAARMARIGKRDMLETLVALDLMAGGAAFTPTQKMFVSNEIEKIFKPRRRSAIPKNLRRMVKQFIFLRKELGRALK